MLSDVTLVDVLTVLFSGAGTALVAHLITRRKSATRRKTARRRTNVFTVYDSSTGFAPDDFHWQNAGGADGVIVPDDGILRIERRNVEGAFLVRLEQYQNESGPGQWLRRAAKDVGESRIRVQCELRALGGEHTVVMRVVARNALPSGEHIGRRRERLRPNGWTAIDWPLKIPANEDCFFMFENRSVSDAPSAVEIRNLVITARD